MLADQQTPPRTQKETQKIIPVFCSNPPNHQENEKPIVQCKFANKSQCLSFMPLQNKLHPFNSNRFCFIVIQPYSKKIENKHFLHQIPSPITPLQFKLYFIVQFTGQPVHNPQSNGVPDSISRDQERRETNPSGPMRNDFLTVGLRLQINSTIANMIHPPPPMRN